MKPILPSLRQVAARLGPAHVDLLRTIRDGESFSANAKRIQTALDLIERWGAVEYEGPLWKLTDRGRAILSAAGKVATLRDLTGEKLEAEYASMMKQAQQQLNFPLTYRGYVLAPGHSNTVMPGVPPPTGPHRWAVYHGTDSPAVAVISDDSGKTWAYAFWDNVESDWIPDPSIVSSLDFISTLDLAIGKLEGAAAAVGPGETKSGDPSAGAVPPEYETEQDRALEHAARAQLEERPMLVSSIYVPAAMDVTARDVFTRALESLCSAFGADFDSAWERVK